MSESLLYLLLGIVFLILRALSKKGKRAPTPVPPHEEGQTLDDFLRGLEVEQGRQTAPVPSQTTDSDGFSAHFHSLEDDIYDSVLAQPVEPAVKSDPKPANTPELLHPLARKLRQADDAREAILFSEILGKPRALRR